MPELTVPAAHLNTLATILAEMAPLSPPPAPKGRYVLARAIPVVVKAAQAHSNALKAFLDGAVTQDAEGKPIYGEGVAPGTITFEIRPEHQQHYADLQREPVTLPGVRALTRPELGECPITVQQEMVLVACGMLLDEEPG